MLLPSKMSVKAGVAPLRRTSSYVVHHNLGANITGGPDCSMEYILHSMEQSGFYLQKPLKDNVFFTAAIDTMAETTSFAIECHEAVQKWKYLNSIAVSKHLILLYTLNLSVLQFITLHM